MRRFGVGVAIVALLVALVGLGARLGAASNGLLQDFLLQPKASSCGCAHSLLSRIISWPRPPCSGPSPDACAGCRQPACPAAGSTPGQPVH